MSGYYKSSRIIQSGWADKLFEKALGVVDPAEAKRFRKNVREMQLRNLLDEEVKAAAEMAWDVWGKTREVISPERAAELADVSLYDLVVASIKDGLDRGPGFASTPNGSYLSWPGASD